MYGYGGLMTNNEYNMIKCIFWLTITVSINQVCQLYAVKVEKIVKQESLERYAQFKSIEELAVRNRHYFEFYQIILDRTHAADIESLTNEINNTRGGLESIKYRDARNGPN